MTLQRHDRLEFRQWGRSPKLPIRIRRRTRDKITHNVELRNQYEDDQSATQDGAPNTSYSLEGQLFHRMTLRFPGSTETNTTDNKSLRRSYIDVDVLAQANRQPREQRRQARECKQPPDLRPNEPTHHQVWRRHSQTSSPVAAATLT